MCHAYGYTRTVSDVSAIVCTRDRPGPVVNAVRSLLQTANEPIQLIVVDQSDDHETEAALAVFGKDPRFVYYRSQVRGKGAALNEALRMAQGAIVVCTDDDCEAPPGWVTGMARALEAQPTAVIVFCTVVAVEHDSRAGHVPAYEARSSRLLESVFAVRHGIGLGAGMGLQREFALSVGGFDESFGPGARFPSADDWDIAIRALIRGRHVCETAELSILHDGFRSFEEARRHVRRDWGAIGALCAKPLRAGYLKAAFVPFWLFLTRAVWPPIVDLWHLRKPRGALRILAFVEGFVKGLQIPVDPLTLCYVHANANANADADASASSEHPPA